MKDKKSVFAQILSLITYKEKEDVREFYIPEVPRDGDAEIEQEASKPAHEVSVENLKSNKRKKRIKSPILVSESKKKEAKSEKKTADGGMPCDIQSNIDFIQKHFNASVNKDIIIRRFKIAGQYSAFIVYMDGMVDRTIINNFILTPLLSTANMFDALQEECRPDDILENVLTTHQNRQIHVQQDIAYEILSGNTGVYIDGCDYYMFCDTKGYDKRGVETPQTESVVKGPQEAFNENLRTNITLLRRIIKNNHLTTETVTVGERNRSLCAVVYLNGLANPAIVNEVKRRINGIRTDFILGDGMLEQFIEDNPWSIIPTVLSTERPDRAAAHIIEGKVVILVESTPFALIVPVTLSSILHSPEDTYLRWQHGMVLRLVRLFAMFVAILLPGMYVALTNFHREMIPTELLIAIAIARENVPFPTILEVLLMEISFELIREAGIRIPGIIGNTIGIIGALILGQAAVQANLVSPVLIIIIAFTGLGNFAIPDFSLAFGVRIIRLLFIFAGAFIGFYGISLTIVSLIFLTTNMKSFGVPFFSPFAPKTRRSFDMLLRWPVWKQELRPDHINPLDTRRQPHISMQWKKESPAVPEKEEKDEGW